MRIHQPAYLALLTATLVVALGCGSARDLQDSTAHVNAYGCDSCHGYPPPPSFPSPEPKTHPQGVTPQQCAICHPGTVMSDGHSIVANGEHRDGQIEFRPFSELACTDCHGAPPTTGAHAYHVNTQKLTCDACHHGFDADTKTANADLHMNGRVDVVLANGATIQPAREPDGYWPPAECQACHTAAGVGN